MPLPVMMRAALGNRSLVGRDYEECEAFTGYVWSWACDTCGTGRGDSTWRHADALQDFYDHCAAGTS